MIRQSMASLCMIAIGMLLTPRCSNAQISPSSQHWTLSETHAWDPAASLPTSPDVSRYIRNSPAPELPPPKRLPYFVSLLNSTDPVIAFDALHEVALAGVKHISTLAPSEIERLESFIIDPQLKVEGIRIDLNILIAGYLVAQGESGLDLIDESILSNKELTINTIYPALQGIRYLRKQNDGSLEKERFARSLRILLDRTEIVDLVVPDLARLEDWTVQDRLMDLYNSAKEDQDYLKRSIISYMLKSTQGVPDNKIDNLPEHVETGRKYLERMQEKDPKQYQAAVRINSIVGKPSKDQKQGRVDARGDFAPVASSLSGIDVYTSAIHTVEFSPGGDTLASGIGDGSLKWWDLDAGMPTSMIPAHSTWCFSIAFHPNGKEFATGGGDQLVKRWRVGATEPISSFDDHTDDVHALAYNPKGRFLYSTGDDMSVLAYDLNTLKAVRTMNGHTGTIPCLAVSPDGSTIATGSRDDTIRLWDPATGKTKHTLKDHAGDVHSVKFSPDGKVLASASYDETVKLWNVESGDLIDTLEGHANWVFSVAFHPDGNRLASGDKDGRVLVWDLKTRKQIAALKRQRHVSCVTFSPDGTTLASSSPEATICLWNWKAKKLRNTLLQPPPKSKR